MNVQNRRRSPRTGIPSSLAWIAVVCTGGPDQVPVVTGCLSQEIVISSPVTDATLRDEPSMTPMDPVTRGEGKTRL